MSAPLAYPWTPQPAVDGLIPFHDAEGADACFVQRLDGEDLADRRAEAIVGLTTLAATFRSMTHPQVRKELARIAALSVAFAFSMTGILAGIML